MGNCCLFMASHTSASSPPPRVTLKILKIFFMRIMYEENEPLRFFYGYWVVITQTTLLPPLCPFGQNNIEYVEEMNKNVNIYLYKHISETITI